MMNRLVVTLDVGKQVFRLKQCVVVIKNSKRLDEGTITQLGHGDGFADENPQLNLLSHFEEREISFGYLWDDHAWIYLPTEPRRNQGLYGDTNATYQLLGLFSVQHDR
jgi:hypothetical protein